MDGVDGGVTGCLDFVLLIPTICSSVSMYRFDGSSSTKFVPCTWIFVQHIGQSITGSAEIMLCYESAPLPRLREFLGAELIPFSLQNIVDNVYFCE